MIEYLLANMWQVWAVIAVLGLILELSSGDFFIICFAIGACGAAAVSPFTGFYTQLVVFGLITSLSIYQVRPFALRFLHKNEPKRVSNADALLGRIGRVTKAIEGHDYGRVAIDGDDWKAKSTDGRTLSVGTRVKVVDRESIIITVESISE